MLLHAHEIAHGGTVFSHGVHWRKFAPRNIGDPVRGRRFHTATMIGANLMIVIGGEEDKRAVDIRILDAETMEWKHLPEIIGKPPPSLLFQHTSCRYENKIIVFGGLTRTIAPENKLRYLQMSPDRFEWIEVPTSGPAPTCRVGHTCCIYKQKMILFGGYSLTTENSLHVFDLVNMRWLDTSSVLGTPPIARRYHCAAVVKNKMVVFGGRDVHHRNLNDTHILNLDSMRWTAVPAQEPRPTPRCWSSACAIGKYMVIFAGTASDSNFSGCNDLWSFDTETLVWRRIDNDKDNKIQGRYGHSACEMGSKIVVFGGSGCSNEINILETNLTFHDQFQADLANLFGQQ